MFLKGEHLSFPSSYVLILDSIVRKYSGGKQGPGPPGVAAPLPPGPAAASSTPPAGTGGGFRFPGGNQPYAGVLHAKGLPPPTVNLCGPEGQRRSSYTC